MESLRQRRNTECLRFKALAVIFKHVNKKEPASAHFKANEYFVNILKFSQSLIALLPYICVAAVQAGHAIA